MRKHVLFATDALLPDAWASLRGGQASAFNPGLLAEGAGWLFAFRIVAADGRRRIGLCRLDAEFRPIPGTAVALTDAVRFDPAQDLSPPARSWFADPRLYRFGGRLFVYWNSGWHEPPNEQFLQPLDPASLAPIGCARVLRLAGPRRPIEKNWTFFGDDAVYCLYDPMQHAVLAADLAGEGAIVLHPVAADPWSAGRFAERYGPLRGGAPPQRVGDSYIAIGHIVVATPLGYAYRAAAYRFAARFPFAVEDGPLAPLRLPNPCGPMILAGGLNEKVAEAIYPCGAAYRDGAWAISYGINDRYCAIAVLDAANIESATGPLPAAARAVAA